MVVFFFFDDDLAVFDMVLRYPIPIFRHHDTNYHVVSGCDRDNSYSFPSSHRSPYLSPKTYWIFNLLVSDRDFCHTEVRHQSDVVVSLKENVIGE